MRHNRLSKKAEQDAVHNAPILDAYVPFSANLSSAYANLALSPLNSNGKNNNNKTTVKYL